MRKGNQIDADNTRSIMFFIWSMGKMPKSYTETGTKATKMLLICMK